VSTPDDTKHAVSEVIAANPEIVEKIKNGQLGPVMSLVGKVMKQTNRRSDPVQVKFLIH